MELSTAQTYLSDILHVVSQSLLAPDIVLLLAFIAYALFSIGSVLAEVFTERRRFKVAMPQFLTDLVEASEEDIPRVIGESGLLKRQKRALTTVFEFRALPGDALLALVKRLVSEEEGRYDRIVSRNNMAAKVAPMLGLMGTLIPLGPGIQALGQADTTTLSNSLLIAFDTTVAGLVTAAVCLVIGKIRSNWYDNYLSALDAAMATMLEKIELNRTESYPWAHPVTGLRAPGASVQQPANDEKFEHLPNVAPVASSQPEPVAQPFEAPSQPPIQLPGLVSPQQLAAKRQDHVIGQQAGVPQYGWPNETAPQHIAQPTPYPYSYGVPVASTAPTVPTAPMAGGSLEYASNSTGIPFSM